MKPESKFWKQVKENLTDIHWTRLENRIGQGIPDCYGISAGISVWVELKVIRSNKIVLSPFQKSWNYSHSLQGGRNFIMATTFPQSLLYIFSGIVAPSIGSIANLPPASLDSRHELWGCILEPGVPDPSAFSIAEARQAA